MFTNLSIFKPSILNKVKLRDLFHGFPQIFPKEDKSKLDLAPQVRRGREMIVTGMLQTATIFGLFMYMVYVMTDIGKAQGFVWIHAGFILMTIIIAFVKPIPFMWRGTLGAMLLYGFGLIDILNYGMTEDGRMFLATFCIFMFMFLGTRGGLFAIGLSSITILVVGLLITFGTIPASLSSFDQSVMTVDLAINFAAAFLFTISFVTVSIMGMLGYVQRAWASEAVLNEELSVSLKREKGLADALHHSLEKEQEVSRLRSSILMTVTHEFRTPLTIINMSVEMLDHFSDKLNEDHRDQQFLKIQTAIDRLTDLLDGAISIENMETDAIKPNLEAMAFTDLASKIESTMKIMPQSINHQFQYDRQDQSLLKTDGELLKAVADIVLSNAVKFGGDEVLVKLGRDSQTQTLTLTITDNGVGIPAGEEGCVFALFQRGSNADAIEGLGLGLFQAKLIIDALSGEIAAKSINGKTTVSVTIPITSSDLTMATETAQATQP